MMTLNNRNMQIRALEVNRESIITLLTECPYLFDCGHLKSMEYACWELNHLRLSMGHNPTMDVGSKHALA